MDLPGEEPHTAVQKEFTIEQGEVRFEAFLNGNVLSYEPGKTVGYWFPAKMGLTIPEGIEPYVIKVPVVPAGAIYAQARSSTGVLLGDLTFSVLELKKSPLASGDARRTPDRDGFSLGDGPRRFVATPVPLGVTYQVVGHRGNNFSASHPIKLTEATPDAQVELQFAQGRSVHGQVVGPKGQPVPGAKLEATWRLVPEHGHGLGPFQVDENGRFTLEDATPDLGAYQLVVRCPGFRTKTLTIDFGQLPLVVRLEAGLTVKGQVIEASSGLAIPRVEVRALDRNSRWPMEQVVTDAVGRFEFSTLNDTTYWLYVDGASFSGSQPPEIRPGETREMVLKVTPYPGSPLQKTAAAR